MPWKKDSAGALFKSEAGDPVWIKEDNSEQPIPSISALNKEAQTQRERADKAEADLAPYKGIDPVKAKEALQLQKDHAAGKLFDQGKVDEAKAEVAKQFQDSIAEKDKAIETLKSQHQDALIDAAFGGSSFVKDKIVTPAGMFKDTFRKNFTIDEKGVLVAKDQNGNVIYSTNGQGGVAGFDEAIAKIVDSHPDRAQILRAPNNSGTGNNGNGGNGGVQARTMTNAEFQALDALGQAQAGKLAAKGELRIT